MGKKSKGSRADFDGAWKQTLDRYLDSFEYPACKLLDFPNAQA
jgi:hypothetical protein